MATMSRKLPRIRNFQNATASRLVHTQSRHDVRIRVQKHNPCQHIPDDRPAARRTDRRQGRGEIACCEAPVGEVHTRLSRRLVTKQKRTPHAHPPQKKRLKTRGNRATKREQRQSAMPPQDRQRQKSSKSQSRSGRSRRRT